VRCTLPGYGQCIVDHNGVKEEEGVRVTIEVMYDVDVRRLGAMDVDRLARRGAEIVRAELVAAGGDPNVLGARCYSGRRVGEYSAPSAVAS
jgi:hypothetical protein